MTKWCGNSWEKRNPLTCAAIIKVTGGAGLEEDNIYKYLDDLLEKTSYKRVDKILKKEKHVINIH